LLRRRCREITRGKEDGKTYEYGVKFNVDMRQVRHYNPSEMSVDILYSTQLRRPLAFALALVWWR